MRPADLTPVSRDALRAPSGALLIVLSFVVALLFNSLPWSGWALALRPDLVLIALLFWSLHAPQRVGQALAFGLGLAMDVSDSMLLGQHALGYVAATFGAQVLRVRVLAFGAVEQTLHVLGLAAVATLAAAIAAGLAGGGFPGWLPLLAPFTTAACWAPLSAVLLSPRLRRRRAAIP